MDSHKTDAEVKQFVDLYFGQRADRLANLKLRDVLKHNSRLRDLIWIYDPIDIVDKLIERYLESHEKWWREMLKDNSFCLHVMKIQRTYTDLRFDYEEESARARNRLSLAMIEQFCNVDYRLDWEKLLLVNDAG